MPCRLKGVAVRNGGLARGMALGAALFSFGCSGCCFELVSYCELTLGEYAWLGSACKPALERGVRSEIMPQAHTLLHQNYPHAFSDHALGIG